jgi:hypothetical protein
MERCLLKDDAATGFGCMRYAGHVARHRIRPNAIGKPPEPDNIKPAGHQSRKGKPQSQKVDIMTGAAQDDADQARAQVQDNIDLILKTLSTAATYLGIEVDARANGFILLNTQNEKMLLVTDTADLLPITLTTGTALSIE